MTRFARIILGYHGCEVEFADGLLNGRIPVDEWQRSNNGYDWLGEGIYFWEHAPRRARDWGGGGVVGAVIQLGNCLDFGDTQYMDLIAEYYLALKESFDKSGHTMPSNRGRSGKLRELDALVVNKFVKSMDSTNHMAFQTVRSPFLEGQPVFEGSGIMRESHTQVAVRDIDCILGIFRPTIT